MVQRNADATALSYFELLRLFVDVTLIALWAILRILDTSGLRTLVLRGRIVTHFADGALESNDISHDRILLILLNTLFFVQDGDADPSGYL